MAFKWLSNAITALPRLAAKPFQIAGKAIKKRDAAYDDSVNPQSLKDILDQYFLPEIKRSQETRQPIENAFNEQFLTPGSGYASAKAAAQGVADTLFARGGEVDSLISRARGNMVGQGFGPDSSLGDENVILRGATQRVADTFATQAAGLESSRMSGLASAYGNSQQSYRDLLESLFAGTGNIQQLGLAKTQNKPKLFGIF